MICSQQLGPIVGHTNCLEMQLVWFSFVFQYHSLRNKRSMLLVLPFCRQRLAFHKIVILTMVRHIQLHMSYQRYKFVFLFEFLIHI
jgi:hypothetical protein